MMHLWAVFKKMQVSLLIIKDTLIRLFQVDTNFWLSGCVFFFCSSLSYYHTLNIKVC